MKEPQTTPVWWDKWVPIVAPFLMSAFVFFAVAGFEWCCGLDPFQRGLNLGISTALSILFLFIGLYASCETWSKL